MNKIPMVIGVTGHRSLPDGAEEPLRKAFNGELDKLAAQYPSTPMCILSALAAGADILAAEEALRRGIEVHACLPMPQDEYEKDFSPEECDRFRAVLSRCSAITITSEKSVERPHVYTVCGTFIVYYSHLLIAFWDGGPSQGPGGTADIVTLRRTGIPSVVRAELIPYLPDIAPVFQIVTPRKGQPQPANAYQVLPEYPPRYTNDDRSRADFEKALQNLDRFNRDIADEEPDPSLDPLTDLRQRTDRTANALERKYQRSLTALYLFAFFAGAAQIIDIGQGAFIRIVILALAFGFFRWVHKRDYENRYQDYRAISEGLRVQDAWCCAGLREHTVDAAYLRMQHDELQWIRMAIRTAYLVSGARRTRGDESTKHATCSGWIEGQRDYYRVHANLEAQQKKRFTLGAEIGAGAAFGLSALVLLLTHLNGPYFPSEFLTAQAHQWFYPLLLRANDLHLLTIHGMNDCAPMAACSANWIVRLETVPPPLAAMGALLVRFYVQQRGFSENARRYQRMFTVFDFAAARLDNIHSNGGVPEDARMVIRELGREALTEHADWLVMHRERPMQFVEA